MRYKKRLDPALSLLCFYTPGETLERQPNVRCDKRTEEQKVYSEKDVQKCRKFLRLHRSLQDASVFLEEIRARETKKQRHDLSCICVGRQCHGRSVSKNVLLSYQ